MLRPIGLQMAAGRRKIIAPDGKPRCGWTGDDDLMRRYHDKEWGVPVHADDKWFEHILLDAFQAGLSWRTILHKRQAFRSVFHGCRPEKVAAMTDIELEDARRNPTIIRNRLKILAARNNAHAFLRLRKQHGSFDAFLWSFTNGRVIHNTWRHLREIPAATPLSDAVSKALKQAGFTFVGSTICYSFLQAGGVVNDHLTNCFRHAELRAAP